MTKLLKIEEKTYLVDETTGEILYVIEHSEIKPMTTEEKRYYKHSSISPKEAKSKDELEDFISACFDKRRLTTISFTRMFHDMACGQAKRENTNIVFTVPQYKIMNKLIKGIRISNVIIGTKAEIANILGCKQCNINRALKPVSHLIRVETEGMSKGQMKIFVHPAYGFKYEKSLIYKARQLAISEWMLSMPTTEDTVQYRNFEFTKEFDVWLATFSKSIKGNRSEELKDIGVY